MKENLGALGVLPKLTDGVMHEIESLLSHAPRS
jgi:hypothetical protein